MKWHEIDTCIGALETVRTDILRLRLFRDAVFALLKQTRQTMLHACNEASPPVLSIVSEVLAKLHDASQTDDPVAAIDALIAYAEEHGIDDGD